MNVINVGVLTISDRCAREEAVDESGPALVEMLGADIVSNAKVVRTDLVPDCQKAIEEVLKGWCDHEKLHLILTTGGTGLSKRDVTPEVTAAVIERTVPGIPLLMFNHSSVVTPHAALSRAIAGVRGGSLIINLPGSKKASVECFQAIASVIPHAVAVINERSEEVQRVHEVFTWKKSSVRINHISAKTESSYPCISLKEAQEIVLNKVNLLKKTKIVGYEEALNHVLAQDVLALEDHPPFDASLKDGYAVKIIPERCYRRILVGTCNVGQLPDASLDAKSCMKVSTGGPIPPGGDAVVAVEDTELEPLSDLDEKTAIRLRKLPKEGENIRAKGSDFRKGYVLMHSGTFLNAAGVGLLAAAGMTSVKVFGKPTVAVMSTGDELKHPHEALEPGKVRDSNRIMLMSLLKEEGCQAVDLGIVRDEPDALRNALEKGFLAADVVVTTGSMSMGERDFLKEVIVDDFHGEIFFGRVLMKPGKPTAFGFVLFEGQMKVWFGLPGNPSSTFVCSELLFLPGLRKIFGVELPLPPSLTVKIRGDYVPLREDRPQYLRGTLTFSGKEALVDLESNQSSSFVGSCASANCLVYWPSAKEHHRYEDVRQTIAYKFGKSLI